MPGGSKSHVVNSDPWKPQAPYLEHGFREAERLYRRGGPSSYPGPTVAAAAPETELANRLIARRVREGSPSLRAARGHLGDTLAGRYLDAESNPHLARIAARLAGDARGAVDGRFARANRTASARHGEALGRGIGDAVAPLYARAYENERNRMLRATMFAPELAAHDFREYAQLAVVGARRQAQRQAEIDARRRRHEFDGLRPYDNLERYQRMVRGDFGRTTTQPLYRNRVAGLLGGGLAGAELGRTLGFDPWIGAGLGALAGL